MSKHIARKRFGQHFLSDQSVIDRIVQAIHPEPGQLVVEIGPGLGAMTFPLLEWLDRLTVIELDRDLVTRLQKNAKLNVVAADVLTVDFSQLALQCQTAQAEQETVGTTGKLRVVGNLPYNISTPVLFHLLEHVQVIADQHFMLQKEVVDRMVAKPSTHEYGRLSVMLQWRYQMTSLFDVAPQAFDPPPKVVSAVVQMVPRRDHVPLHEQLLSELVKTAFSQRRKLLRHTLGRWLEEKGYTGSFDVQRRAQEVSVAEYIALCQSLTHDHDGMC